MKIQAKNRLRAVNMDSENGLGQVPNNSNVDYMGLRVLMKPSVFLKLALPFSPDSKGEENIVYMVKLIKEGKPIAPPFLQIEIPEVWEKGLTGTPAKIDGHEGRHRMTAIKIAEGDHPVEVHLFPKYYRNRHITPQWIKSLNYELIPEGRVTPIKGPFFEVK